MQPLRLGVIGAGLIWIRRHQHTLATLPDAFVPVAFADLSPERRAQAAESFPDATVVAGHQELLALPGVDAVLVLTPIALNAPVALAALHAGKDVIMEKPIARSAAEGAHLIETARQLGRRLYVTEQMGYRRGEEILAEIIASGEIGDLVMWERVEHLEGDRAVGPMSFASTPWRKEADFPLGTLFDGGIHVIAALTKVFGRPERVWATGKKLGEEYGEFGHVAMLFAYANGSTGMLSHSSRLAPDRNHFTVYGSAGTVAVEWQRLTVIRHGQEARVIDLPDDDANVTMWRALADAFHTDSTPAYTAERALQDVLILESVDRAIHQNQVVAVGELQPLGHGYE
ncbi:MAG: Gfo/Idh/MocA family oxidoreductase [Caldilineaceae bacterium]|nr:Gfo/Idh/MocA family oxidoreductase [Caldilineaceae bacterium]